MLSWGFRMALAGTVPVLWGLATGRITEAVWITLTAESVSWVELKGSFTWRLRALFAAAMLAIVAAILGSVTGNNLLLGCICMFGVAFISTLLKNIGDRASGLAICFYMLFIVCNAFPAASPAEMQHRAVLIVIGAVWPLLVGLVASAFLPEQEPFRRHIAIIWRSIASLADAVSKSDTRAGYTGRLADVYKKEGEVRAALDSSFEFYSQTAHHASRRDNKKYQLIMLRKTAGLVAVNVIAMGDEMEHIAVHKLDQALRIKAAALFGALREAAGRMSAYVITMNPEEKLLTVSQISRLRRLTALIRTWQLPNDTREAQAITRILQLTGRTINLLENAILRVEQLDGDKPVFRSYSLIKTSFIYTPRYLWRNLQVLFNINTFTFRYALRSAIAATAALFIYKWYNIDHGYWMPFSLMIVIQPYFGATFKKARDRMAGTLLGVIAGSALLHLPQGMHLQEVILFFTFVLMVYYVKRNYAISAFFITLNLVLLFNIEATYSNMLMVMRVISTVGGSLLAVAAGWLLLPTWDKNLLPGYMAKAVQANFDYFIKTFFAPDGHTNWTRMKRLAESGNSNAFDSFNRYMQEPGTHKSEAWYDLITCNVRVTRNLNNMHMEHDEKKANDTIAPLPAQQQKIAECHALFGIVLNRIHSLYPGIAPSQPIAATHTSNTLFVLNDTQMMSLEKMIVELKAMQADLELQPDKTAKQ
jgi:uncharacterized membrane protein YccC